MVPVDIRFEDDGRALLSFQTMVAGEHRVIIKVKNKQLAGSPYKIWSRQNATHESILSGAKQSFMVNNCFGVAVHHNGECLLVIIMVVVYKCSIVMDHRSYSLVHQAVEMVS